MPSNKHISILSKATGWFLPSLTLLHPEICILTTCQCFYRGSTKAYLCFPFLSSSRCWWRFAVCMLWLQGAVLAGALPRQFFAWNVTQSIWNSWKQSVVIHSDCMTHHLLQIDNWGMHFDDQTFHSFSNEWSEYRDAFHAALLHL